MPENDRLLDHLRRRLYARKNFPSSRPPYFDDRGKYYLKYGKPALRYQDPGGIRRVGFFGPQNYNLVRRLYPYKGAPEQFYTVVANETWAYENVARDFVVHFMKEGVSFREIASLSDVIVTRQRRNLPWQWSDLVKQRATVSPVLARAAMRIEQFETSLIHAAGLPRRGELIMGEIQAPAERIMEIAASNEREAGNASRVAPVTAHDAIKAVNRLSFSETIAQFRGPNGHTRVEITLLAPLKKNFVEHLDTQSPDTLDAGFAWMLRDHNFDSMASQHSQSEFPVRLAALENLPNAVGRLSFLALPQQAELSLQVQNRQNGTIGYSRKMLDIRDFNGSGLMLSDPQFFTEVTNENQSRILPALDKQNMLLSPYPYSKVRKRMPLFCYFEIYNLRSSGITEAYEITYKVVSDLGREGLFKRISRWLTGGTETAISLSHAQPVVDDATQELIAIDISNLANGAHRLEISATDTKDRSITARVSREIDVED